MLVRGPRLLLTHCVAAVFVSAVAHLPLHAEPLRLTVPTPEKTAGEQLWYFPRLLKLALDKTVDEGAYDIRHFPQSLNSARTLSKLRSGELDVIWAMTNPEREKEFIPVRVSLLRGLSSHRVLLIREQDQAKFAEIDSLEALKALDAGLGDLWPDTDILRANGLPVTTSPQYELLFNMLAGKRFDYIPRGLYEVWEEYERHRNKGLVIESSLMLYYNGPMYFFVNRENAALAKRIERGLYLAQQDGSLDELFMSVPSYRLGLQEMHNPARRVVPLKTPAEIRALSQLTSP